MIKKAIITLFVLSFSFNFHSNAETADPTYENVKEFNATYIVNKDGSVDVTERILYYFPSDRHGIFRIIPFTTENQDGKKYKFKIEDVTVDGGPFTKSTKGEEIEIKIGDPNKYVNGEKQYVIHYKLKGALTYFSDHDEFYWNVTGTGWDVPIERVYATVTFPFGLTADNFDSACYTGSYNSSDSFCNMGYLGKSAQYTNNTQLYTNEGLTIVAGFPKGLIDVMEPKVYRDWGAIIGGLIWGSVFFGFYVALPIYVFLSWLKDYRMTKKARIVAAWFEPPKDADNKGHLSPAETSVLIDKTVDSKDLTATLIDLAQRGYLKIRETVKKKFLASDPVYEIVLLKDTVAVESDVKLKDFEKLLLTSLALRAGEDMAVSTETLSKSLDFGKKIDKFYDTVSKGLVAKKIFKNNPHDLNSLYLGLGIMSIFFGDIPLFISAIFFGRRSGLKTELGVERYGEAVSLKNFLVSQDEQLNFQSKNQMFFEKLLPYATAFGVEKVWAKRFSDIVMKNPDWYEGQNFNIATYAAFNHAVRSSFASSYATSTRSSSGHSSGFGGGGFSGGGGGGGGGGSW